MLKKGLFIAFALLITVSSFSQIRLGEVKSTRTTERFVLTVNSNVRSSIVFIDGKQIDGNRIGLAAGTYAVEVRANGYISFTQRVDLTRDTVINARLEALAPARNNAQYTISVNSNVSPFDVYINGRVINGNRVTLSPGRYDISVRSRGYLDFNTTIELTRNQNIQAILQPEIINYSLTVNSNAKNSQILINGSPINGNITTLRAGTYSVTVKARGFLDFNTTVNLDRNFLLNANLVPEIPKYSLRINSNANSSSIIVDGIKLGSNSIILDAGNHTITVTAPNYVDYTSSVNLNKDMDLNIALQQVTSKISVRIPANLLSKNNNGAIQQIKIYDNNKMVKGLDFELEPGQHNIRIESGSFVLEGNYNFMPGQAYTIEPVMYLNIK